MRDRLANESAEQREARLQQMRDRLANESAEQGEARLQRMSDTQRERMAAETIEEREVRLQHVSEGERECLQSSEQLFKQRSVQVYLHILYFCSPSFITFAVN